MGDRGWGMGDGGWGMNATACPVPGTRTGKVEAIHGFSGRRPICRGIHASEWRGGVQAPKNLYPAPALRLSGRYGAILAMATASSTVILPSRFKSYLDRSDAVTVASPPAMRSTVVASALVRTGRVAAALRARTSMIE